MPGLFGSLPLGASLAQPINRDPAGFPIDLARPILLNPDGSFSTEETITVGFGDRYFNIPTIWNGKRVDEKDAIARALESLRAGGIFPNFPTLGEAEAAAVARTKHIGLLRGDEAKRKRK